MRKILLCSIVLLSACREGTPPYEIENAFKDDDSGRLTFNLRDDRVPAFGASNDTVIYQAQSFLPFDSTPGMLFAAPRVGGTVRPILESVQVGVSNPAWLTAPAISPNGAAAAFWEVTSARDTDWSAESCASAPINTQGSSSVLQQAVLRVRRLDGAQDDAKLVVNFEGRTIDPTRHPLGFPYVIINIAYPFHRHFERYGVPIFRASWSPDGSRVVFSDGLRLRIWVPGQATTTVIPNTDDAILPAWNPSGDDIAFTKLVRGASANVICFGLVPDAKVPQVSYFERTVYESSTRDNSQISIIRADGTGLRTLGIGEAPAWTPDGTTILARRNGMIAKIPVDGGPVTEVANTNGGFEPAISRDGRWVAFARQVSPSNHDIWVAPF
jgi:hypothetical protein